MAALLNKSGFYPGSFNMQIQPILDALRRHRLASILIALEIALACAVLCNACFLIVSRVQQTRVVSGVDENALAALKLTGYDPARGVDLNARVLSGLAKLPGVQSVSAINQVPFGDHAGTAGITTDAEGKHPGGVVDFFVGGPGSFKALGVQVVAGRVPQPDDYQPVDFFVPDDSVVWVTRALAEHLWPGADPLGKEFWTGKFHFRVAGVLAHLARPYGGEGGPDTIEWSVYVPAQPGASLAAVYLLRADPAQLPRVLRDARAAIATIAPDAGCGDLQRRVAGVQAGAPFRHQGIAAPPRPALKSSPIATARW